MVDKAISTLLEASPDGSLTLEWTRDPDITIINGRPYTHDEIKAMAAQVKAGGAWPLESQQKLVGSSGKPDKRGFQPR